MLMYDTVIAFIMLDEAKEKWQDDANSMIQMLYKKLRCAIHVGVSSKHTSLYYIRRAYLQSCQALWEIMLQKDSAISCFYSPDNEGTAEGSISELRKQILEITETAELTEESVTHASSVIATLSGLVASNMRSMTMLYAIALIKKFPPDESGDCEQILNNIWFITK